MAFTDGVYKVLYIKSAGTYFPVGCLTDNNFQESVETISTTTRDNPDGWETDRPTKQRYSIDFSGVVDIVDNPATLSYRDIQSLKRNRTLVEWKIENAKGDDIDYGSGHITSLSDTAPIEEFISFSGNIKGYGQPLILTGNLYIDSDYIDDYYI